MRAERGCRSVSGEKQNCFENLKTLSGIGRLGKPNTSAKMEGSFNDADVGHVAHLIDSFCSDVFPCFLNRKFF